MTLPATAREEPALREPSDLRLPAVAVTVWLASLAARGPLSVRLLLAFGGAGVALALLRREARAASSLSVTVVAWVLLAASAALTAILQGAAVQAHPARWLAEQRASVDAEVVLTGDPHTASGRFGDVVTVPARAVRLVGRGHEFTGSAPVLLLGDSGLARSRLGERILVAGRMAVSDGGDLAGVISVRGSPRSLAPPGPFHRAADRLRASIRDSVADRGVAARGLLPALVDGDDGGLPDDVDSDFRTCGLTHLLAVSGTNLTLLVGFLLVVARGVGVRARGLMVVGAFGVVGFVLLARPEPSVLRAAAMGSVALLGMGSGGRARGVRAWGAAVIALVLLDPWLAGSPGFALSALATAGILLLAPGWRDAMTRWLPRWLAEAIAVPLAAQLACTPIVAALSGQVSLIAVLANLLAGPAVGPATVLGLLGGAVGLVHAGLGAWVAWPAALACDWVVAVARRCADVSLPAFDMGTGAVSLTVLTALCLALVVGLTPLLARRWLAMPGALAMTVVVLVPLPTPGWPPRGWVMVMCDVGQGDGLVLATGPGQAMVVDAGPDPAPMKRCLDRLGVRRVPMLVLTHFHADHVDGLPGVLAGREVGAIWVTPYALPEYGAAQVHAQAAAAGVPVRVVEPDQSGAISSVRWQVLAPREAPPPGSGSPPNDSSVVLLVRVHGLTLLLMGDEEPGSQEALHRAFPDLRADVLKVAHHGSAKQDPELIAGLGARLALISVGEGNDYGHPAPSLVHLLRRLGPMVLRTDRAGDIAVVEDGGLRVRTRG